MRPDPKARCVEYKRIQAFLRATGTWHTFPLPHTPSLPPEREREREGGTDLVAGNSRVTKDGGLRISSCGEGGAIGVLGRSGPKARKLELEKTKWKLPSRRNFPFRVFSRSGENAIGEASAVGEASTELSCRLLFLLLEFSSKMKPGRYTFRIPSLFYALSDAVCFQKLSCLHTPTPDPGLELSLPFPPMPLPAKASNGRVHSPRHLSNLLHGRTPPPALGVKQ